jgi:hypothetical protein
LADKGASRHCDGTNEVQGVRAKVVLFWTEADVKRVVCKVKANRVFCKVKC